MDETIITRVWHGTTPCDRADEYLQFLSKTAVSDYQGVDGNLGVEIWRRIDGDICHFWTVSRWDSYDSIRKFAGDDVAKAKYYPEDQDYLLEFEDNVIHCETYRF